MTWRAGGDGRPVAFPRVPWHESVEDKADRELEGVEAKLIEDGQTLDEQTAAAAARLRNA